MYLTMVWMLTLACIVMEGFLAWNIPGYRTMFKRFPVKVQRLLDFGGSMILSYGLGLVFQVPPGLVTFMAAVLSTILSMPMYPMMDWAEEHMEEIKIYWMQFRQACQGFIMLFILVGRFLFVILIWLFKAMVTIDKFIRKCNEMWSSRGRRPSESTTS